MVAAEQLTLGNGATDRSGSSVLSLLVDKGLLSDGAANRGRSSVGSLLVDQGLFLRDLGGGGVDLSEERVHFGDWVGWVCWV